ncbi:metallophosphoesterase family protein [Neolewinella persica]|uniref:metallophosphoesterase family protein n=1 Tax=Neolewinella persica TaxID=70998 RepID=UPI000476E61A|nr:metallophosphoesterase family protein [Neolewinella persica]
MRQFAISDIHGHLDTFKALLRQLAFSKRDELFLLGDFIDRGPNSKGVIDYVKALQAKGRRVHCLRGNHEQMCVEAPNNRDYWRMWLQHGGKETCASFASQDYTVPEKYLSWMKELPLHLETEGYLFVHAGIDTRKSDPLADQDSLLWARNWTDKMDHDWLDGRIIVHGHTPTPVEDIQLSVHAVDHLPVINVDAGCFAKKRSGMGYLCALELGSHALTFQKNVG